MVRLSYNGDVTTDKDGVQSIINQLIDASHSDNGVSVDSVSLRIRDGEVRIITTLSADGEPAEIEGLIDTVAEAVTDLGFEDSLDDAKEAVEVA